MNTITDEELTELIANVGAMSIGAQITAMRLLSHWDAHVCLRGDFAEWVKKNAAAVRRSREKR